MTSEKNPRHSPDKPLIFLERKGRRTFVSAHLISGRLISNGFSDNVEIYSNINLVSDRPVKNDGAEVVATVSRPIDDVIRVSDDEDRYSLGGTYRTGRFRRITVPEIK